MAKKKAEAPMPKAIEVARLDTMEMIHMMEKVAKTGHPITVNLPDDSNVQIIPGPKMQPPWGYMKGTMEIVGDIMSPIEETRHARDLDRFE